MKTIRAIFRHLDRFWAVALIVSAVPLRATAAQPESHYPIPAEVLARAGEYAISKVGETFFDSCMTLMWARFEPLDPDHIDRGNIPDWLRSPRYIVLYRLRIPEKPFVDEVVVVNIKQDGGWFKDTADDEGLPDCVSNPAECEFPIDEDAAIEIAKKAGLQTGVKPWKADFRWRGRKYGTYVWEVENTLSDTHGEAVLIDANSGAVLEMGRWESVVTP
jgi:hypothetical protein